MIRRLVDQAFNSGKYYISAVGLSTDVKPTEGIITGSKFVEVDTGIGYLFDETSGEWHENQQLSAAVQAYFEDHPEAIDQAAIEAMFGEQLDGIEEDIGRLKSALSELADFDYVYNAVSSEMEVFTKRTGYIASSSGWDQNSTFNSYYYLADADISIYWDSVPPSGTNYTQICAYSNCDAYTDASASNFIARKRNTDNNLPTENNKWNLPAKTLIVISVWTSADGFNVILGEKTTTINENVLLSEAQILQTLNYEKKPFVKYTNGSGNDSSAERLDIFIPTNVGFVDYQFVHTVNADRHADIWRVAYAMAYNDAGVKRYNITTAGEWECAVHLKNRDDFSGGYAHGDEIVTDIAFWLNGEKIGKTDISVDTKFDEFVITQTSNLYDPDDSESIIAVHGSKHIFSADGLIIEQTIDWMIDDDLTACYMAMFPPAKAVTDAFYTNKDYAQKSITTYPIEEPKTTDMTIYSTSSGVTARFAIAKYPTGYAGGDVFILHDNGTGNYNKCYYAISYTATPAITNGTRWESETIYKIDVSE